MKVCWYVDPVFDSCALGHCESNGEQKRPSALPGGPLTTLWPSLCHVHRTVSPTAIVIVAGVKTSALPGHTMTVCVRAPGVGVVVVAGDVIGVVVQLPASQASQQLRIFATHAEPPDGAVHAASLDLTEHLRVPLAAVRQHATEPVTPHVDFLAHRRTSARHALGRLALPTASFTTRATQRT